MTVSSIHIAPFQLTPLNRSIPTYQATSWSLQIRFCYLSNNTEDKPLSAFYVAQTAARHLPTHYSSPSLIPATHEWWDDWTLSATGAASKESQRTVPTDSLSRVYKTCLSQNPTCGHSSVDEDTQGFPLRCECDSIQNWIQTDYLDAF